LAVTRFGTHGPRRAIDRKQFWETKILEWEQGRYGTRTRNPGILEWAADRASASVRFRIAITPELLRPFLATQRVVELGCGSGLLARPLIEAGAASYLGIDLADTAVRKARERYGERDPRITFRVGAASDGPLLDADLVVSLGLLDWLTGPEIADLFRRSGAAHFLHAVAERRCRPDQWIHRVYVQLAYGRRTADYRPRYMTCAQVKDLARAAADRPMYAYRDRRLSFGVLVSSLPIGEEI
jgi:SAM-dependent methyltransferase